MEDRHLTDAEWEAVLCGEETAAAGEHLAHCAACRNQQQALQQMIGSLRTYVDRQIAARPVGFWARQRAALHQRLEPATLRLPRLAWAVVTAMVVVSMALLLRPVAPHFSRQAPAAAVQVQPAQDELLQLEASVDQNLPNALAPAGYLAVEMDRAVARSQESSPVTKENHR